MKKNIFIYFILFGAFSFKSIALEIDEKLTVRVLKISSTKKTLLLNRGSEDGLVVGDHAKFFETTGVVARGVVVKASPSRTVWSLYRIIDAEKMGENRVLNIKISSPVKVTDDPSKSLAQESTEAGMDKIAIPLEEGANDLPAELSSDEKKEINDFTEDNVLENKKEVSRSNSNPLPLPQGTVPTSVLGRNNWEVYSLISINNLTGTVDSGSTTDNTASDFSSIHFALGMERSLSFFDNFLRDSSFALFIDSKGIEVGDDIKSKESWLEYGGQFNYYVINSFQSLNDYNVYGYGQMGVGSGKLEATIYSGSTSASDEIEGAGSFAALGLGTKLNLKSGLSMRAQMDYYLSSQTFTTDTGTDIEKSISGLRINFGMGYQF